MADHRPAAPHERSDTHEDHDPELIVALLDRDLADADRSIAHALVADCASCAELHTDLIAVAQTMVAMPIPARPRDFALSPAMAADLSRQDAREPGPARTRLSGEMPDTRSRHAAHDRLLIANLIDRAVDEAERARAEELLAACSDCEQLYDDLVALSAATRAMAVAMRPREFTLTAADAERLRVRGWRRLLAAIGSSRDTFSRPLALGLTTLGLAGLMVATIPSVFMGGAASGPQQSTAGNAAGDAAGGTALEMAPQASAPATTDERGPAAIAAAPTAAPSAAAEALPVPPGDMGTERIDDGQVFFGSETSPLADEPDATDEYAVSQSGEGPITRSTTIIVAGLMLVGGLILFGLRWTARRLGDG